MKNILTIDVEELHHRLAYSEECEIKNLKFHGSALLGVITALKLLKKYKSTATFFIIGEILEKFPEIGSLIVRNGHEIANHTYYHTELNEFKTLGDFEKSIDKTDEIIYKSCEVKSVGFRSPKWNLPKNISKYIDILKNRGYKYDSSLFPANGYGYGTKNSIPYCYRMNSSDFFLEEKGSSFFEIPTSVYNSDYFRIPVKFRHFGPWAQQHLIRKMNKKDYPAVLTIHTWELIKMPHVFLGLGSFSKNFIRNFNIPFTKSFEKILKNNEFESIINHVANK